MRHRTPFDWPCVAGRRGALAIPRPTPRDSGRYVTDARLRAFRRTADRHRRRTPRARVHHLGAEAHRREAAAGPERLRRCRSSSRPGRATAARRSPPSSSSAAEWRRRRHRGRTAPGRRGRCRSPTTATSTGAVVFAGYGIVVPDSQDFGYDSYATLDVKDKVVLVLRYFPEDADQKTTRDSRALLGSSLQGDGRPAARRESDAGRHRSAIAERGRAGADDVRHRDRRAPASSR